MRAVLAIVLSLLAGQAFAQCAPGYTSVPVPLCRLNSTPAPVITSPSQANCTVSTACSIQITATNNPTSWGASPLPAGMSVSTSTGVISGTPTATGTTNTVVSATNAGGTGTAGLDIIVNPAVAAAFYVATTGSDSNAGTLAAPFATLPRCQTAMQGSSTKTCYIRAGSYTPPSTGSNCNGDSVTCMLDLSSADNGETFSYYPPDGVDTADFNGQSSADGNGMFYMIGAGNASSITINGLFLHNFQYSAIRSSGSAGTFLIENNIISNGTATTGHTSPGGISCYGCSNWKIFNNFIHDIGNWGINFAQANGDVSGMDVENNVIINTCTGRPDCAAIYVVDTPQTASNITWKNNYIRDGNTGATLGSGYGSAMYADDCSGGVTATGNVVAGRNGSNSAMLFHGGKNIHVNDNLVDLSTFGQHIVSFQTSTCTDNSMSGNQVEHNIVISGAAGGGYNILSGSPPTAPVITASAYHNYGSGTLSSGGNYSDSNPTSEDPQLSCWVYTIAGGSPVFNSPVSFPGLPSSWGPSGFVIPHTGTVPSSPHTC